jgi:ribosomal protein L28
MSGIALGQSQLAFFNRARSYQPVRGVVNFWASDGPREISFYVSAGALKHLDPKLQSDEEGFLKAFDANRSRIEDAANKVYRAGTRGSYELDLANF